MERERRDIATASITAGRRSDGASPPTPSLRAYHVKVLATSGDVVGEFDVRARTPGDAARQAVDEDLVRGEKGVGRQLRAKVYWSLSEEPTTMVRFYAKNG